MPIFHDIEAASKYATKFMKRNKFTWYSGNTEHVPTFIEIRDTFQSLYLDSFGYMVDSNHKEPCARTSTGRLSVVVIKKSLSAVYGIDDDIERWGYKHFPECDWWDDEDLIAQVNGVENENIS